MTGEMNSEVMITLKLDWRELSVLRHYLTLRMKHCEKERDERSDKFNIDSYISMKFLLLDIRELLLGQVL